MVGLIGAMVLMALIQGVVLGYLAHLVNELEKKND
jgi:hypothetical protein